MTRPRVGIEALPFQRPDRPWLGVEVFKLSDLLARSERGELGDTLWKPQRPEFHVMLVGLRGAGHLVVDFDAVPIGARWITVMARGRVRQFVPDQPTVDAWCVLIAPEVIAEVTGGLSILSPLWPCPALSVTSRTRTEIVAIANQLAAEHARPPDRLQPDLLASLVRTLLLRVERLQTGWTPAPETSALARFFTILERDHAKTRSVAHYAREAGISPRRLGELLFQSTGLSTKQVIDERVILEHKRLLAHTEVTVKELAALTGFAEPTNLVKFFRRHTKATPERFRFDTTRTFLPSRRRS